MEEKPSRDSVKDDFDALPVNRNLGRFRVVVLKKTPSETQTGWAGEFVYRSNRIGVLFRKLLSINPCRDGDAEIFVVFLKVAVAGSTAWNRD